MSKEIKPYEEQALDDLRKLTEADFYPVRSQDGKVKKEPSARALQKWANERGISTAILETEMDNEHVFVKVAGWLGNKDNPIQYKEAAVNINFRVKEAQWLFQQAAKGRIRIELKDGRPKPVDETSSYRFYQYAFNLRDFALRVAVTKAEAIVHKKLLSLDWREKEEKEFEEQEVEAVKGEMEQEKELKNRSESTLTAPQFRAISNMMKGKEEEISKYIVERFDKTDIKDLSKKEASEVITFLSQRFKKA